MDFGMEAVKGTHVPSRINQIYFSATNIDALQNAIRYRVYKASCNKYIIDRQSDVDLKVVMRAVYFEHARHNPLYTPEEALNEVKRLNGIVLDTVTPQIVQEINMYSRYKKDISQLHTPMARGIASTIKGENPVVLQGL
jgi:hypothetical protein